MILLLSDVVVVWCFSGDERAVVLRVEALNVWRVCLSYGLAGDIYV